MDDPYLSVEFIENPVAADSQEGLEDISGSICTRASPNLMAMARRMRPTMTLTAGTRTFTRCKTPLLAACSR
jgi:hypothetical protein